MRAPEFWERGKGGVLSGALSPLGWTYGLGARAGGAFSQAWQAPVPVLCVGNAVAGGAGKTPVALDIGARLRRPLVTGLLFVFGWEPVVIVVPGYMKNLSVAYYLQGLVPHAAPQDAAMTLLRSALQTFEPAPAAWICLLALAAIWTAALGAAVRTVARREYVLDR